MPVLSASNLTSGHGTTGTTKDTASITPSANKLIFVAVGMTASTTPNQLSISGCNMTWTEVVTREHASANLRISIFRGVGSSPTSGALTISTGGQTIDRIIWSVDEITGAVVTGTNGSDGIVQSNSNENASVTTSFEITLDAFSNINNGVYGVLYIRDAINMIAGSGFTELSEAGGGIHSQSTEFKDSNDTTVDFAFASSGVEKIGAAVELKAVSSGFFAIL